MGNKGGHVDLRKWELEGVAEYLKKKREEKKPIVNIAGKTHGDRDKEGKTTDQKGSSNSEIGNDPMTFGEKALIGMFGSKENVLKQIVKELVENNSGRQEPPNKILEKMEEPDCEPVQEKKKTSKEEQGTCPEELFGFDRESVRLHGRDLVPVKNPKLGLREWEADLVPGNNRGYVKVVDLGDHATLSGGEADAKKRIMLHMMGAISEGRAWG